MKKLKVFSISAILIAICCSFLFSASVSAASKKHNKFDHKPSGNIYYYDENGHTVKGLVTIRGKKYYFNEKGIQQNGWQRKNTLLTIRPISARGTASMPRRSRGSRQRRR